MPPKKDNPEPPLIFFFPSIYIFFLEDSLVSLLDLLDGMLNTSFLSWSSSRDGCGPSCMVLFSSGKSKVFFALLSFALCRHLFFWLGRALRVHGRTLFFGWLWYFLFWRWHLFYCKPYSRGGFQPPPSRWIYGDPLTVFLQILFQEFC